MRPQTGRGGPDAGPGLAGQALAGAGPAGQALAGAGPAGQALAGAGLGGQALAGAGLGAQALTEGGCAAWPLPADATCAAAARDAYRETAAMLGLSRELSLDGVTMASELATNTLHAHANVEFGAPGTEPFPGAPELWLYLRRPAGRWELVCKVFDSLRGWKDDLAPGPGAVEPDAVSGRGLWVVAGLSDGRWGHHLTRSRFGGRKVPGKAVWFGQAVPDTCVPGSLRRCRLTPGRAARALEEMLAERGLGGGLLRAQEPSARLSVVSVRYGLTVWCRDRMIWWRTPDGRTERRFPTELVDTAEELVRSCEEMDCGPAEMHAGAGETDRGAGEADHGAGEADHGAGEADRGADQADCGLREVDHGTRSTAGGCPRDGSAAEPAD